MSDKRLEVFRSQTFIVTVDFRVFSAIAVQASACDFVEHDGWEFRATPNDGRVGGNIFEFAEHLADRIDHLWTWNGNFCARRHCLNNLIQMCFCHNVRNIITQEKNVFYLWIVIARGLQQTSQARQGGTSTCWQGRAGAAPPGDWIRTITES